MKLALVIVASIVALYVEYRIIGGVIEGFRNLLGGLPVSNFMFFVFNILVALAIPLGIYYFIRSAIRKRL